jgi:hypothetical protein
MNLFAYNFCYEVIERVWDLLFIKGHKFLFRVSLAIFHLMQRELLACQTMMQITKKLEEAPLLFQDPDLILQVTMLYKVTAK